MISSRRRINRIGISIHVSGTKSYRRFAARFSLGHSFQAQRRRGEWRSYDHQVLTLAADWSRQLCTSSDAYREAIQSALPRKCQELFFRLPSGTRFRTTSRFLGNDMKIVARYYRVLIATVLLLVIGAAAQERHIQ